MFRFSSIIQYHQYQKGIWWVIRVIKNHLQQHKEEWVLHRWYGPHRALISASWVSLGLHEHTEAEMPKSKYVFFTACLSCEQKLEWITFLIYLSWPEGFYNNSLMGGVGMSYGGGVKGAVCEELCFKCDWVKKSVSGAWIKTADWLTATKIPVFIFISNHSWISKLTVPLC